MATVLITGCSSGFGKLAALHFARKGDTVYASMRNTEKGAELEQWERAKAAATEAIVRNGGALSHHHGIGSDHRRWMPGYLGEQGARWLSAIKTALDPDDILNPGKLVPPSTAARQAPPAADDG